MLWKFIENLSSPPWLHSTARLDRTLPHHSSQFVWSKCHDMWEFRDFLSHKSIDWCKQKGFECWKFNYHSFDATHQKFARWISNVEHADEFAESASVGHVLWNWITNKLLWIKVNIKNCSQFQLRAGRQRKTCVPKVHSNSASLVYSFLWTSQKLFDNIEAIF